MPVRAKEIMLIVLSLLLVGFAARKPGGAPICEGLLPEIAHDARTATAALAPWLKAENRMPASLRREGEGMAEVDRQSWLDWAQDQLKKTQSAMDTLDGNPREAHLRQALSRIATEWVTFTGYAAGGRAAPMVRMLGRIETHSSGALGTVCGARH